MRDLGRIFMVVSLALAARAGGAPTAVAPAITVDAPVIDAGTVRKGAPIEARFLFRNAGGETLSISDARPACGCTVATFDREVAPGASGEVRATVQTKAFSGPITKHIAILSNDPVHPRIDLTVKAVVEP